MDAAANLGATPLMVACSSRKVVAAVVAVVLVVTMVVVVAMVKCGCYGCCDF